MHCVRHSFVSDTLLYPMPETSLDVPDVSGSFICLPLTPRISSPHPTSSSPLPSSLPSSTPTSTPTSLVPSVPQFKSYEDEPESAPTPSSTSSGASSREHTFTRPVQPVVNAPVSATAVKNRMTSGSGARASMRAGSAHTSVPKSETGS